MITILHGDNVVASRRVLNEKIEEAKGKRVAEVVRLDGKKVELSEIKQAMESTSLFGGERMVVIENLLTRPKSKALSEIGEYFGQQKPVASNQTILWEGKSLTPTSLKLFGPGKTEILEFKPAAVIFKLTDAIRPGNAGELLTLLKECVKADSVEMVFYMLSRQIRLLLQSESNDFKMAPWQMTKIKNQRSKFKNEKILRIHEQLLLIDERVKTGQSQLGLEGELEMLLLKI